MPGFVVLVVETFPGIGEGRSKERSGEDPWDFRAPSNAVRTVRPGPGHPGGQVVHNTVLKSQKRNTGVLFIG